MSTYGEAARRGLGIAGLALALTFGAAATAQAAPAAAAAPTASDGVTADCTYVAIRNTVVRSGPGTQHPVVRTKTTGQHMTGPAPCLAAGGWFRVYLSTGTFGYTPAADVRFVS